MNSVVAARRSYTSTSVITLSCTRCRTPVQRSNGGHRRHQPAMSVTGIGWCVMTMWYLRIRTPTGDEIHLYEMASPSTRTRCRAAPGPHPGRARHPEGWIDAGWDISLLDAPLHRNCWKSRSCTRWRRREGPESPSSRGAMPTTTATVRSSASRSRHRQHRHGRAEASYATRRTDGVGSPSTSTGTRSSSRWTPGRGAGHAGSSTGNENGISVEITGRVSASRQWWLANVAWDRLAEVLRWSAGSTTSHPAGPPWPK
ncbi:hypothetical protein GA0074692_6703 [Micromonospora pallida]|uniref:Uncharacterized protein n=1 Tax=Micromonospora pallida TaxID=145854 RepID=A0A1C6TKV4_9ACTN|nr:hypothetical protein GA0074692_6703 [Micromonospora pallida]